MLNLVLIEVSGLDFRRDRSHVIFTHIGFLQRVDILEAMSTIPRPGESYDITQFQTKLIPSLRAANTNRNKVIHEIWGMKDGDVMRASITARGKLKFTWKKASMADVATAQRSIEDAMEALGEFILKSSISPEIKPPQSGQ